MGAPQDWAPYSSVDEAAKVYLRDPELALDQLRSVVDLPAIRSFIMSRGLGTEIYCESFRYYKSVDNGGLAQMQRLLQFGRVLSRCME